MNEQQKNAMNALVKTLAEIEAQWKDASYLERRTMRESLDMACGVLKRALGGIM